MGEHGSIAIVERFIRSMKSECTRRIMVPFRLAEMRFEMGCYATWYNEHRPHQALNGKTPVEVYTGSASGARAIEPRPKWPVDGDHTRRARPIQMDITFVEGRRHLPVVDLQRAA